MRRPLTLLLAGLLAGAALPAVALTRAAGPEPAMAATPIGASRLAPDAEQGIATFGHVPTAADVAALRGLGLTVQPMEHLPLAIVAGPTSSLLDAVDLDAVVDVYPDDRMQYFWDKSTAAMTADATRAAGFTGKGVQVAVVDSGIDATHPDLADHVVHNVKLFSGEYVNQPPDPATPDDTYLVVPVDQGPHNNTDNTSGHGTHVAGIIAADGTTDPSQIGVAPDAELIGYAIGEVLFTTAVITAYDHMLDNPEWGIDVVNNSWGNSFGQFDPKHPINVATKAVADTGVVVVFAAGNSGDGDVEMTINPFSTPPWVLSVASGTITAERSSFSSNGLAVDNSMVVAPDADGHVHFDGNRLGQYHPDITAPGSNIISSGTTTAAVGPSEPGGTAEASGTSMATPHVAGAAAVLLSAKPDLSVAGVFGALEASAVPMADDTPFWQVGFGWVDLNAAVQLVQSGSDIAAALAADRARLLAARPWSVQSSDLWTWDALPVTLGGVDTKTIEVAVGDVDAVKVTLSHPSLATLGVNGFQYDVTVRDAAGEVVGTGTEASGAGTVTVLIEEKVAPGPWTVEVSGQAGVADPDTIDSESIAGTRTTLQVAQLHAQTPPEAAVAAATYEPGGALTYSFGGDGGATLPIPSPEGCEMEDGAPSGVLTTKAPTADAVCKSGQTGWTVSRTAGLTAVFTSEPIVTGALVGGPATAVVYVVDDLAAAYEAAFVGNLIWTVNAVDADDVPTLVGEGEVEAVAGRNAVTFDVPVAEIAPGARLQLTLAYSTQPAGAPTNTARIVYGGGDYADAGIRFTTGTFV